MKHKFKFMFVLVLFLVACGGGEEATAIPTDTQPPPAPTDTQPPPTPTAPPTPSASEHNEQGNVYFDQGDMEQAAAEYQAAIELEPDNDLFHDNLGAALAELGMFDQAVTVLKKAIELNPERANARSNLCFVYQEQDQLEAALTECETALMLDDEDAETYNNLGLIYAKQDNLDEAIIQFQKAIQLEPEHDSAHINLGSVYADTGRQDEALAELREAIRITPDSAIAFYNLGQALARQELYEQAIPAYQKALEFDPHLTTVHMLLGTAYLNLNQLEQAIAAFETYLELEPDDPDSATIEAVIARLQVLTASAVEDPLDDLPSETSTAPSSNTVSPPTTRTAEANGYFVFDANPGGNYEIFVINADGSNLHQLTFNRAADADPSWSPDGSQIVFVSDRDGPRQLYIVDAAGLNLRRLTDNAEDNQSPHWSPDGDKIAFVSLGDNSADVFVINSDGSGQTNLSNHPSNNLNPAWSPDGSQIAFVSDRDGHNQIYVMHADGSHQSRLTDIAGEAILPAWSPTGDQIAFTLLTESEIDVYVVRLDGSDPRRITDDPGYDAMPVWIRTPGEPLLAFVSTRGGNAELYMFDPQGNLQQITNVGAGIAVGFVDWTAGAASTMASIDFAAYTSSDGALSYRLPSDWLAGETPHENYITLSFVSDPALLQDADFSQPLAFMLGELWLTEDYGEHDPATLHDLWVQGVDKTFSLEPAGEPESSNRRGVTQITQVFGGSAPDGSPLYLTLKTVVSYGRFAVFCVGVSASGRDALSPIITAVLDSIEIQPGSLSVESIDFTDPAAVLQAVFDAARTRDFAILPHLCDPLHMNDVGTTELCSITDDHELKDSFVQYYGAGRIAGEVEYIEANQKTFARINFIYGPSGSLTLATMELIQRDGLWYLLDQTGG
jgi:Tol biopolymer transport system component/Flp pilus assembly protein TadD